MWDMYKRVMAVDVFLWGRHVGRIAPDFGSYYQFQYDPDFVRSGVQIAPICMPLRDEIYKVVNFDLPKGAFSGLPGVFADSLPDSFGNALIDKWMDEQKIPKSIVSTLDRLAYMGSRDIRTVKGTECRETFRNRDAPARRRSPSCAQWSAGD